MSGRRTSRQQPARPPAPNRRANPSRPRSHEQPIQINFDEVPLGALEVVGQHTGMVYGELLDFIDLATSGQLTPYDLSFEMMTGMAYLALLRTNPDATIADAQALTTAASVEVMRGGRPPNAPLTQLRQRDDLTAAQRRARARRDEQPPAEAAPRRSERERLEAEVQDDDYDDEYDE